MKTKIPIQHIGVVLAICNPNISANLREDLGYKRYKALGVKERFKDEPPYRICKNCLKVVLADETKGYSRKKRPRNQTIN